MVKSLLVDIISEQKLRYWWICRQSLNKKWKTEKNVVYKRIAYIVPSQGLTPLLMWLTWTCCSFDVNFTQDTCIPEAQMNTVAELNPDNLPAVHLLPCLPPFFPPVLHQTPDSLYIHVTHSRFLPSIFSFRQSSHWTQTVYSCWY